MVRGARALLGALGVLLAAPSDGQLTAVFTASEPFPGTATVSMQPGGASGANFDVEIRITGIDDVFGAAFDVQFDPALASFVGFDSSGSFLEGDGATAFFAAQLSGPGVLVCGATRVGPVPGVDAAGPPGSDLILTLGFTAVAPTVGTEFSFGPPATRAVFTCDTVPCEALPDSSLTWVGGTLTSSPVAIPISSHWALALFGATLLALLAIAPRCGE